MSKKQIKAARMLAEGELQQWEIAQQLNITPQTITRWKKNEKFMKLVEEFIDEIVNEQSRYLKQISRKATNTLENLLFARSEMVRFNAATDILDRVGLKPVEKQDIRHEGKVVHDIIVEWGGPVIDDDDN